MQLLAVACLTLAAKVDETEVPVSLDLQVETLCSVLFSMFGTLRQCTISVACAKC